MLIKTVSVEGTGGFNLLSIPEGEEVVPKLESLMFDVTPVELSSLKTLVAGALLFGNNELERIEVNGDVSKTTVKQVQSILGIVTNASEVKDLEPALADESDTKIRATTLKINLGGSFTEATPERDLTTLSLIPSERYSGVLWGIKEAIVPSNAWLHEHNGSSAQVAAAAGVLFAEEFLAKSIRIPSTSEKEAFLIRELCNLVGLDVVFED